MRGGRVHGGRVRGGCARGGCARGGRVPRECVRGWFCGHSFGTRCTSGSHTLVVIHCLNTGYYHGAFPPAGELEICSSEFTFHQAGGLLKMTEG